MSAGMSHAASVRSLEVFPNDIWRLVFDTFDAELPHDIDWGIHGSLPKKYVPWELETIQNLRLVCRGFNYLASPLLCPFLRLEISHESIERATHLIQNGRIASGLRGIQLSLAYRPGEFAADLSRYVRYWQEKLNRAYSFAKDEIKFKIRPQAEGDDPYLYRTFRARDEQKALARALKRHMVGRDSPPEPGQPNSYQELFRCSYERHRSHHFEQYQLLVGGLFVRRISALVALVQSAVSLHLTDEVWSASKMFDAGSSHLFLNRKNISEALVEPQTWTDLEKIAAVGHFPIRVLTELPIAIHEAGGRLRSLTVSCFPSSSYPYIFNFRQIYPPGISAPDTWKRLRSALRELEVLEFGPLDEMKKTMMFEDVNRLRRTRRTVLESYISAGLSSHCLRKISIDLSNGESRMSDSPWRRLCRMRIFLPARPSPAIRELKIKAAELPQRDIEDLCRLLASDFDAISLSDITSTGGSWSNVLSMLREKVGHRWADGLSSAELRNLSGGELGRLMLRETERLYSDEGVNDRPEATEYDLKMRDVRRFVKGACSELW